MKSLITILSSFVIFLSFSLNAQTYKFNDRNCTYGDIDCIKDKTRKNPSLYLDELIKQQNLQYQDKINLSNKKINKNEKEIQELKKQIQEIKNLLNQIIKNSPKTEKLKNLNNNKFPEGLKKELKGRNIKDKPL